MVSSLYCGKSKFLDNKLILLACIINPDITSHLEPIEKTILYLESGRNKTVLQKIDPETCVAVETILKEIE
ncbi:MAG: hypothetical protein JXB88_00335 [Spirochaetales bacterium]|nr:hypothetical protein [Spirochaetales bacterium]